MAKCANRQVTSHDHIKRAILEVMSSLTVRVPGHDYDPYGQNMLVPGHSNRPCGQLNTSTMLGRALILTHPLGIKNNIFELPTFTFIHTPYWHL